MQLSTKAGQAPTLRLQGKRVLLGLLQVLFFFPVLLEQLDPVMRQALLTEGGPQYIFSVWLGPASALLAFAAGLHRRRASDLQRGCKQDHSETLITSMHRMVVRCVTINQKVCCMAKPNYQFEKRQREQQKKQKKVEKALRKAAPDNQLETPLSSPEQGESTKLP